MGVGRVVCVALPFILTICSIICMLVAGLAGVTNDSLYMFQVNTTDLTISPASTSDSDSTSTTTDALTSNITVADLGLADLYDITLWGYCLTSQSGSRNCTKGKFNWAEAGLNTSKLTTVGSSAGVNVTLPSEVTTSLNAFITVTKWTEVVYIIAMLALGLELLFGFFTACSRGISCLTWIFSGIATIAVIAAASMMTAMSVVVVGSVEATAKYYGVSSSFNRSFLATVWMGAAFAIAAGLFWMFTICCCKPERRSNKRHMDEGEKLVPNGAYAPLHDGNNPHAYNQQQYGVPRHQSQGRSDLAYEPYSHSRV
ncbi:SUR7 protein [Pseudomassariella vexata]|uniref:SUR7 protein n=1 Tax=Pseudomassariella vexata TaxID=1141098 RepID=A0A1Y2D5K9_9PEZI|nr:SUR7 protein [Pseudomassariella vexata]ORY54540.1 SUR7 protein [Pseudomassariella vexata]